MGRFLQTVLLGLAVVATSVSSTSGKLTVTTTSDKPVLRVGLQNFEVVDNDDVRQEGDDLAAALAKDELLSGERRAVRSYFKPTSS